MTRTVLVVDDSLTVRMDLVEAFEAAGYRARPCASIAEVRVALGRETIDVAVLDVVLPDGDGVALLAELRADPRTAAIPVLMLSSEAEIADRIRGLATGADDYVGKPYDTGLVVARASELVRRRGGDAGAARADRAEVLVIDDSMTYRSQLAEVLERAGYGVTTASSGADGLRAAAARRPSAVIVDGEMPGIDGPTVIRRIRIDPALRTTPCILLTASDDSGAELRALDSGADAFVRKGEEHDTVLARLATLIRKAGAPPVEAGSLIGPKRILAIDDDPAQLGLFAGILQAEGHDVVTARSGDEALELLGAQSIDCILLDLVMPGLGGAETCKRIKASPVIRDLPLVALAEVDDRQATIDALGLGADDCIAKTSEVGVIQARVRALIRRKQFEDEHRRVREDLLRAELEAAEARAARELAEARAALVEELERKNRELEAFSYSVSHDLRAPLRSIEAFSRALLEDHAESIGEAAGTHLHKIRAAVTRMGELIEAMLELSRVSRSALRRERVDLSAIAAAVVEELRRREPERAVAVEIAPDLVAQADARLVRALLDNLLGNAWKFTAKIATPRIEVSGAPGESGTVYSVRDNGAGFDMAYASRLFIPFQRLHASEDFRGTGIGLATVQRIVERHGGRVWAAGEVDRGAVVSFTLAAR